MKIHVIETSHHTHISGNGNTQQIHSYLYMRMKWICVVYIMFGEVESRRLLSFLSFMIFYHFHRILYLSSFLLHFYYITLHGKNLRYNA